MILGIYMDNGIVIGNNINEINKLMEKLKQEFKITIMHEVKIFVGFEVLTNQGMIKLKQKEYAEKLLRLYRMNNSKLIKVPMTKNNCGG